MLFERDRSLHMDMPVPKPIKNMRSMTTLTPFYDEDVLYTKDQMVKESAGDPSWCFYLKVRLCLRIRVPMPGLRTAQKLTIWEPLE